MKTRTVWFAVIGLLPLRLVAQAPAVPTMDHEPHHHLAHQNDYVKLFNVEVSPGDSIILHSHDQDTIAIAIGEQLVTVGIPGKADVHQKNADGQVRLQRSGYIHSTHVDGDAPYHTVAVELMRPQTNFHNVCAEILPGQPLNCPPVPAKTSPIYTNQTLLESDQTRVRLVRVPPNQEASLEEVSDSKDVPQLIIAIDAASISTEFAKGPAVALQPGDYFWIDRAFGGGHVYRNANDKESRFIEIVFPHGE